MAGPAPAVLDSCATARARLGELGRRTSTPLPPASIPDHFRRAAVLLLVGCVGDQPCIVLTERAANMRSHASEISLPGGRIEPGETAEQATVREGTEEVGIEPGFVELFGRLDEAWSKGRNHVVPVVGWYGGALGDLRPSSPEVADVFVTPLARIARPDAHSVHVAEIEGRRYENDVI